jgi:hypothetical protein
VRHEQIDEQTRTSEETHRAVCVAASRARRRHARTERVERIVAAGRARTRVTVESDTAGDEH